YRGVQEGAAVGVVNAVRSTCCEAPPLIRLLPQFTKRGVAQPMEPQNGLLRVPRHSIAVFVHPHERSLSRYIPPVCRHQEPLLGSRTILGNTASGDIHVSQRILRGSMASFGRLEIPTLCQLGVLFDAFTVEVHVGKIGLRRAKSAVCSLFVPGKRK